MNTIDEAIQYYKGRGGLETVRHVRTLARWTEIFQTEHQLGWDPDLLLRIMAGANVLKEDRSDPKLPKWTNGCHPASPVALCEEGKSQNCIILRICDIACKQEPGLLRIAPKQNREREWEFHFFQNPDPNFYNVEDWPQRVVKILEGRDDRFRLAYHFIRPLSEVRTQSRDTAEPSDKKRREGIQGKADDLREIGREVSVKEFLQRVSKPFSLEDSIQQIAFTTGQFSMVFEGNESRPQTRSMEAPVILDWWRGRLFLALRTTRIEAIESVAYNMIEIPTREELAKNQYKSSFWVQGDSNSGFHGGKQYEQKEIWYLIGALVSKGEVSFSGQSPNDKRTILLKW